MAAGSTAREDPITLTNSTLSGNFTQGEFAQGGGIFSIRNVILTNSTVSGNRGARGGGIAMYDPYQPGMLGPLGRPPIYINPRLTITSSVLAGNTGGPDQIPSDCERGRAPDEWPGGDAMITVASSLFQATGDEACDLTTADSNLIGEDPQLGALTDNGCETRAGAPGSAACVQTHALVAGSPAINASSNPDNLTTDQRGQPRQVGSAVDMGAFETASVVIDTGGSIRCSDIAKWWIHRVYRGYYGRCAERGGFRYWCERLDAEGGSTDPEPIMAAFGTSREYSERLGGMSDVGLLHSLYQNMFNREAERGGLRFYLALLDAYRLEWRADHDGSDQSATEYASP